MAAPHAHPLAAAAAAVGDVLGSDDLAGAITALVHTDDLMAWSLVCRPTRRAQVASGRALVTRAAPYARSVEGASWAHARGASIGALQRGAASCGCVEVLRWSVEEAGGTIGGDVDSGMLCLRAARSGSVEAVAYLRDQGCSWDAWTCSMAAKEGQLHVLQWARAQDPPCPWDSWTCAYAAKEGQLHVLQWLRAQDPPCPWGGGTCDEAAEGGQLHVLQWLRAQDPPCPWDERTCTFAAIGGHMHVLQWLRAQDPPCLWSGAALFMARLNGHRHVVEWLKAAGCPDG